MYKMDDAHSWITLDSMECNGQHLLTTNLHVLER